MKKTVLALSLLATLGLTACSSSSDVELPAVTVKSLPVTATPDFNAITNIQARKDAFVGYLLPYIQNVQAGILQQRAFVLSAQKTVNAGQSLSSDQLETLQAIANQYRVSYDAENLKTTLNALVVNVNTIPTSMILGKAALESGWGTSRFVKLANNYFGMQCFTQGCGIVPNQRRQGSSVEVRKFATTEQSVQAYFNLMNSGGSFEAFRAERAKLAKQGKPLDSRVLIKTLGNYSELGGQEYERRVLSTMNSNNFYQYDNNKLAQ